MYACRGAASGQHGQVGGGGDCIVAGLPGGVIVVGRQAVTCSVPAQRVVVDGSRVALHFHIIGSRSKPGKADDFRI